MITPIDHQVLAIERLATQFKNATNLIAYINALLEESNELETTFGDLLDKRYIDTAEGVQLDIIGEIVGQPRSFSETVAGIFFGFVGSIGSGDEGFGTIGDPLEGETFRSLSDVEYNEFVADDTTYRLFIRSKIVKNHTKVTINDVIEVTLSGVTSVTDFEIQEFEAAYKIAFNGILTDEDKILLSRTDFIPKPAGVGLSFSDDNGNF